MASHKKQLSYRKKKDNSRKCHICSENVVPTKCLEPLAVIVVGFLASSIVAAKIKCFILFSSVLQEEFSHLITPTENQWIGILYACFALLLIPLWAGFIELIGISYRWAIVVSGVLQLVGAILSSVIQNPGYLLLTDSFLSGTGASLMLAVIILIIDDYYPHESGCRVTATSFVQGTLLADFVIVGLYSATQQRLGWRDMYLFEGISLFALTLVAMFFFSDNDTEPFYVLSRRRAYHDNVIENITTVGSWRNKMLGITLEDFTDGVAVLPWIIERFISYIIMYGLFGVLLVKSDIINHPVTFTAVMTTNLGINSYSYRIIALVFSMGSTTSYLVVSIIMNVYYKKILHCYALASFIAFFVLLIWQLIQTFQLNYASNIVFAWLVGSCLGALHTGTFAACKVATDIDARRMFPLIRMIQALAITITRIFIMSFNNNSVIIRAYCSIFGVLVTISFSLMVYIIHLNILRADKQRKPLIRVEYKRLSNTKNCKTDLH